MQRFYVDYVERLQALHDQVHQVLADLPSEALDWVPGPDMNSVTILVVHLAGAERYWIGDVAASEPSGRDRAAEFRVKGLGPAALRDRLDASLGYARETLARFSVEDLAATRTSPRDGRTFTVGWALLHALEHTAMHLGHIQLTAQTWQAQVT